MRTKRFFNKSLIIFLVAVILMNLAPFAFAGNKATEGIYTYEVANGEATITKCNSSASGAIEIPATLGEYTVTKIGRRAFWNCRSLTSVTIANNVTDIGDEAFLECSSLTSVTIGNSVTSIGDSAFKNCSSLKSVTIPDSVMGIGYGAFSDCSSLTSVIIPVGVTSIAGSTFSDCSSLKSVTIPDSVTSIGNWAFEECSSLTNVTIPDSVTSIDWSAFSGCRSLTSVAIPDSVTSIGVGAFSDCSSLTNVIIPDGVTSIGVRAFSGCGSMTAIDVDAKNPSYSSADGILFSNNKNELIQYPGGKEGAYTIPDSVTSIGDWAFSGCHSLTSVSIGNSVTSIGKYAFYSCSSLTNVTIPDNVTSIGEEAFSGCGLTSVTIGNGVRGIGDRAFSGCHSLTSVSIGNSVTSIGVGAFSGCRSLTSVIIPDSVTSIGKYAFSHCSSLTSVAIGNSVTSIRDEAFYWCDNLISVTIPESVTSISDNAFSYSNKVVIYGIPGSYAETYARNNGIPFKPYEEPPAVDKTQLEALITETEQLKSGDYTAESWADFTEALQAAKAVSAKTGVTQTEVDNAYAALSAAKGQLVTMDEKAAKEVDDEIAAIGTVTLESKAAIASARSAYNALTQERKDLVKNLGALQAAEAAYAALVAEKDEELVTPAAEAIDGTAALSVTEPEMATAVSKAIEYECSYITIKPQIVGEASKVTVELPKASLISMASNTEADLRVETTVGTVSIPRKVIPSLTAQAEGKSITVILESVDKEKTLNKKQKKAVGDKPVYEIAIKSGENRISSFEGCGITIILPYTLKEGETTDDVKVWYLNDAGELEQIACGYDAESGLASFTTEHLSYFTIGVEKNDGGEVKRIAGGNRYDTSAKTALDAYPGGAETVIIARGDDQGNFADALAASYLAGVEKAPILLTSPGSLPQEIEDAVKKLGAKKAYVLGGELAVSQRVESKLNSLGLETERIIGNNRYATAAAIAARGGKAETAIVVSGYAPADSLVAGPLAFSNRYPILLVDKNSVPAETKKAIADLGIKNIIVIGGENVVSKAVYSELNAKKRYAGQSRVATSLVVAEKSFAEAKDFSIVSYLKLADAVGAAVCGNPIIYVKDNISDVKNYLTGAARTNTNFTIYGGALAVNSTVENELKKLLQ